MLFGADLLLRLKQRCWYQKRSRNLNVGVGGLTTSTESSRGAIGPSRVSWQWDYPFGWAPHQMLIWDGLIKYGYVQDMERLVYRWLHVLVRVAVDYNGAIAEKYDVTQLKNPSKVDAEYGNQGLDFKGVNVEG